MITIYQCVNWILCYRVGLHPAPGPATGQAEWSAGGIQAGRGAPCQLWGMKEGPHHPWGTPLKPLRHVCFLRNTCSALKAGGTVNSDFLLLGFFHLEYLY